MKIHKTSLIAYLVAVAVSVSMPLLCIVFAFGWCPFVIFWCFALLVMNQISITFVALLIPVILIGAVFLPTLLAPSLRDRKYLLAQGLLILVIEIPGVLLYKQLIGMFDVAA
ncbi:MAG: hypothetical protein KAH23_04015 [Kiritimatiellae bacterium]|nr:hypothetical protein [Kiritimatiellia bacterium]